MIRDRADSRGLGRQDGSGGSGPVRAMVRRLRRKLGDNGSIPRHFFTEPRDGHRMEKRDTQEQEEPE